MRLSKINKHLVASALAIVLAVGMPVSAQAGDKGPKMNKQERVALRNGNKLYEKKRYAEAEVEYRKALQVAPQSAVAQFNLATALLMQGGGAAGQDDKNNPVKQAADMLTDLAKHAPTKSLRSKANYDLGNLAYGSQQYDQAVQLYKQALREDPADDQARYNLRMAQLKLKQQQQNKDQNQNQDKKDKDKKDQDKKDQDKKDQDKKDQDKKDQDKKNQDQNNQDKKDQDKQQQQGGMSQQNAEQVLKTMQNQENATQQRINAARAQQERRERARTNRKW